MEVLVNVGVTFLGWMIFLLAVGVVANTVTFADEDSNLKSGLKILASVALATIASFLLKVGLS